MPGHLLIVDDDVTIRTSLAEAQPSAVSIVDVQARQRLRWCRLLAVVALLVPITGRAQAPKASAPQAKVRELATIEGDVNGFFRLPNGRAIVYHVSPDDSTFAFDIVTKHRTLLGTGMHPEAVSPQGNRFAFSRWSEDRTPARPIRRRHHSRDRRSCPRRSAARTARESGTRETS